MVPAISKSELAAALSACRGAFWSVGLFSGVVNLLMLTGSIYMLQVYDRVIPSRSIPTLVGLTIALVFLFAMQGALDYLRQRILIRIGSNLDSQLSTRIYESTITLPMKAKMPGDGLQPIRDLDSVRGFLSGLGPTALFDLPWLPLYLAICFLLHPLYGYITLAGMAIMGILTYLTEIKTLKPSKEAAAYASTRSSMVEASRRNAEAILAMGMIGPLSKRWAQLNDNYLTSQEQASDVSGGLGSVSKIFRLFLQSAVLGLGAYLVINGQASSGVMIAASIITSRALAPIDLAIGQWKGFVAARQSWERLGKLLDAFPQKPEPMPLPPAHQMITLEGVAVSPPGGRALVQNISFGLRAGQGLGIIGPSASGKSTLVRALVGVWAPLRGVIRLDGAALEQWSADVRGAMIGYMPQDVELFEGTVAENIARFRDDLDASLVVNAAKAAGAHEMILKLPNGYDSKIGEAGASLSAGQRQRVALARALYGDPFLVVLDEPNSNLDAEGEAALNLAIKNIRDRGGIAVIVAHRPSALAALDVVMVLNNGVIQLFGPRDEVLRRTMAQVVPQTEQPANDTNETDQPQEGQRLIEHSDGEMSA